MEGAVQVLYNMDALKREPILAVVGELQFDVVRARLENEYSVPTLLEHLPITVARWVTGERSDILKIADRSSVVLCQDVEQNYVALFREEFYLRWTTRNSRTWNSPC